MVDIDSKRSMEVFVSLDSHALPISNKAIHSEITSIKLNDLIATTKIETHTNTLNFFTLQLRRSNYFINQSYDYMKSESQNANNKSCSDLPQVFEIKIKDEPKFIIHGNGNHRLILWKLIGLEDAVVCLNTINISPELNDKIIKAYQEELNQFSIMYPSLN